MTPQQLAWRAAHYTPWYERIGDGGPLAWAITAGYLLAALLCWRAARRSHRPERALWQAAGAALLFLGVNKQLDLQVGLIEFWRENALTYGWYGARRMVQWVAFGGAIIAGGIIALWLLPIVRRQSRALHAACAGLALIATYVVLRAAKFQHVLWDVPGNDGPGWLSAFELAGIALTAFAAWRHASAGK